jgi:predicted phosphodiesterase
MKTPISILCISDLHLRCSESMPIIKLGNNLLDYANNNSNNQTLCWIPDYIVIAGDIVDKGQHDYGLAQEHVNNLIRLFHINPNHLIIVPGNHDSNIDEYNFETYKNECEVFDNYQNNVSKYSKIFWDHFSKKFDDYISFCNGLISKNEGNKYHKINDLFPCESYAQKKGVLSGVRYFEEDSLCFLYVNTEWLYVNPKIILEESNKDLKRYLSIKEQCKLCAPVVNDAFQLIKQSYPRATVITVMHRFFNDLNIFEYNNTDKAKMDPVRQIEKISDLILTGHEHRVSIEPPSFINNRYQHISIGATGIESTNNKIPVRTACVININPAQKVLKMLNASYNDLNSIWTFEEDDNQYSLHGSDSNNRGKVKVGGRIPCIKAKRNDKRVIVNAIKEYFRIADDTHIIFVSIKSTNNKDAIKNELENAIRKRVSNKLLFFVLYRIIFEGSDSRYKDDEEGVVKTYRQYHIADIADNVIIKEVNVIIPRQINVDY